MFHYLGDQQIDDLSVAVALTPPTGAHGAIIQAQTQNVRARAGGTAPTAAIGLQISTGATMSWRVGPLAGVQLIQEAAGAKAFVIYTD
jgi:hypothetical protein